MVSKRKWTFSLACLTIIVSGGVIALFTQVLDDPYDSWMRTYGTSEYSYIHEMIMRSDNENVMLGTIDGSAVLIGIDGTGAVLWTQPVLHYLWIWNMILTLDKGLLLFGTKRREGDYDDLYLCRLNASNSILWERSYSPAKSIADRPVYIQLGPNAIQTPDGGFIVASLVIDSSVHERERTWLLRLDSMGSPLWNISYPSHAIFEPLLFQHSEGYFSLVGSTYRDWNITLIQFASNGTIFWDQTYEELDNGAYSVTSGVQTQDGGYALACNVYFGVGRWKDYFLRIDANGRFLWYKTYPIRINSIIETKDGNYALAGVLYSDSGDQNARLMYIDANGTVLWDRIYGGVYRDSISAILQTPDEGFILAGGTLSFGIGNNATQTWDAWVFKTDKFGYISQLPKLFAFIGFTGWMLSIGGAFALGIFTAELFLKHQIKEEKSSLHSSTNLNRDQKY
ncbi:MAG: hypothetical protein ACFFCZ_17605 [Promethearchaeota archaeon]